MRLLGLGLLMVAAIWFGLAGNRWLDPRPVQRILILGHSFTYYHDMPAMVAKMADSADSPARYDITMSAFPNATAEDHWGNRKTRRLLSQGGWQRVILQPEGGLRAQDPTSSMQTYGARLLAEASAADPPMLVINHLPTEAFHERHYSVTRLEHGQAEQQNIRMLAAAAGADVADIASIWDQILAQDLPFSIYKDGNHPSLEGSYLIALIIYSRLSGADVTNVAYVPWGMSGEDAELLRTKLHIAMHGI